MPKGVYERKPKDEPAMANETAAPEQPSEKMFPVKLLKNYRPAGAHEVVGYHRPEKSQKGTAGKVVVVQEAAFIEGETAPPPYPGVGFDTKVWASTVLKLPIEEAKKLVGKNLAVRADALPG
jgi:hypothetical protein